MSAPVADDSHESPPDETGRGRRLALAGACNFRDLGGYPTSDGRRVRWGRVFRSDALAELTPEDVARVEALGLRTIFDLRHETERTRNPDRPIGRARLRGDLGFLPHGADEIVSAVAGGTISADGIIERVSEVYRRFPLDNAGAFARLLDALALAETLPALVHCTSGRDRTGFAAAMLLRALGVERETIAEDYALSERYRRDLSFLFDGVPNRETLVFLSRTLPVYLEAAFRAIDERWGSDDAFLEDALGVTEEKRERLCHLLLES